MNIKEYLLKNYLDIDYTFTHLNLSLIIIVFYILIYIMESKIIIKKLSTSKPKKQKPKPKQKKITRIKSKGQDTLVKESTYSHNLHVERIEKLVKIAKERIKEEIMDTQKRTPSNSEVDKIYKDRLNEYSKTLKKTMKSVAIGGPASLL